MDEALCLLMVDKLGDLLAEINDQYVEQKTNVDLNLN